MAGAGEVVALAEAAVDLAKLGLVAQTLVTAALPPSAAGLLPLRLPAGAQVQAARVALLALAAGAQVARLAAAGAAGVRADGTAAGAVGLGEARAATVTFVVDGHLETVLEADGPDGEALLIAAGGAVP